MNIRNGRLCATVLVLLVGVSCSDSSGRTTETSAPTTVVATTVDTTTTLPAPTTLPAAAVFLHSDGLGEFVFGAPYEGFSEGIVLEEDSDDGRRFPIDSGTGFFLTDDEDVGFGYPRGRAVCWNDGVEGANGYLCAYFGGPDADTLTFVGWDYLSATDVGTLFSSAGATVNALVSSVPGIPVPEGACFSYTSVIVDGITLDLVSDSGAVFGETAADGSFVPASPQPADARVRRMSAGETFFSVDADC